MQSSSQRQLHAQHSHQYHLLGPRVARPPPPRLPSHLLRPCGVGVRVSASRPFTRSRESASSGSSASSSTNAGQLFGLAGSLCAAVAMVLASPADSTELHTLATPAAQAHTVSSAHFNPVYPPLASSELFFSDGTPYRSVAELICGASLATAPAPPPAVAAPADTSLPPSSIFTSPWDDVQPQEQQQQPVSLNLSGGEGTTQAPAVATRTQQVLGDLAALPEASISGSSGRQACEVDQPTPGTVPASADELMQWEQQEYGSSSNSEVSTSTSGSSGAAGVGEGGAGGGMTVGWLQRVHQAGQVYGAMPDALTLQVPTSGVLLPVRLPLMSLASHAFQLPWWAQLGALVAANVLGLQAVLAVIKRLGDRAEPLTLVRLQLGLVHPPGAPGGQQLKELRSRLGQLTSMKQAGQSGLWLIVEETLLELSKHQQCAALADVSAVHMSSKLEAYDVFGQFAREESIKARAEEVNAHVEGDNSCAMDWSADHPPSQRISTSTSSSASSSSSVSSSPSASGGSNGAGLALLQWLQAGRAQQQQQEASSGCDDAMVVTVIVVARGHLEVPDQTVSCWGDLCSVMKTVCGLTSDRMIAVDVTWAPSADGTFLTRETLVSDYPHLKPICKQHR